MNTEQSTVLELCKFINPDKEKISSLIQNKLDFPWVLGQILFNRMGAIAYYTLKKCNLLGEINREIRNTLKDIYISGLNRNSNFKNNIKEIEQILSGTNLRYSILKGGILSYIYPKGLRNSNDIDILIEKGNVEIISQLLKENGYLQGYVKNGKFIQAARSELINSMINRGETIPFIKPTEDKEYPFIEVDINFSLDYKSFGNEEVVKSMLDNIQKDSKTGLNVLDKTDFIIHLCLHLYKEASTIPWVNMNRDLSIYKFCDIYLLLNNWKSFEFYENLKKRIHEFSLEKECFYALYYTKTLFDINSQDLNSLLSDIKPPKVDFMKEIISPKDGRVYKHDMDFLDWLFSYNRSQLLYELVEG